MIKLVEKFSLFEKISIRVAFYGVIIIGALGIYLESILWGLIYTAFIITGTIVLLYCLCAHCPYPYKFSDCLILPYEVIKKIYRYRSYPMSVLDKIVFILILGGLIIIPQYWLFKNQTLLIIFWIFCIPAFAIFPFYFCNRCQHSSCPFNHPIRKLSG